MTAELKTSHEKLMQTVRSFIEDKIPMMSYTGIEIVEANNEFCTVKIPYKLETKNHLNSMYFGALAIGADGAGGLIALYQIMQTGKNISLVFKDFNAKFLSRPEDDVYFTCQDGKAIGQLIQETIRTGERVNWPVKIIATVPSVDPNQPVAEFVLTLSLKYNK